MRTRAAVVALVVVVLSVAGWVFNNVSTRLESVVAAALTTTPSFATGNELILVCDLGRTDVGTGEVMGLALLLLAGPPLAAVALIARCAPASFQATTKVGPLIHIALIVQHASLVSGALPLLVMLEEADLSTRATASGAVFILHGALNLAAIGAWRDLQLRVQQCPLSLRVSRKTRLVPERGAAVASFEL